MPIKQQQELCFFASGVRNSADTWQWVNEPFGCLEMWTTSVEMGGKFGKVWALRFGWISC